MKIRRLLLGLVAVTVLVSCEPPAPSSEEVSESETSAVSASEEPNSESLSVESSSAESSSEWVAPEPVRRVAEYWNFTPLSAYTGDFWSTIDFSLRGEALRQALETYMWSKMKKVYYYDAFHAVKIMDADPNNPDNILSVYDLKSQPHAAYNGENGIANTLSRSQNSLMVILVYGLVVLNQIFQPILLTSLPVMLCLMKIGVTILIVNGIMMMILSLLSTFTTEYCW